MLCVTVSANDTGNLTVPKQSQEMADTFQLNKLSSLLYQMEDNKLPMQFAAKLHWVLSLYIVLYSYDFLLCSVALGDHLPAW